MNNDFWQPQQFKAETIKHMRFVLISMQYKNSDEDVLHACEVIRVFCIPKQKTHNPTDEAI